jgi:hypothetical protein
MTETVRCPYCRAIFSADSVDEAKGRQHEHLNDAHDVFDIVARGEIDELAGLVRSALDTTTQRGGR